MEYLNRIPSNEWENIITHLMDDDPYGSTYHPLVTFACYGNNYDAIKVLVEHGVNVEAETSYKETAFMIAVKSLKLQSIIAFIECGANIQTKDYQGKGAFDVLIEKYPSNSNLVLACASVLFHSGLCIDPAYLNVVPIELVRLRYFITK